MCFINAHMLLFSTEKQKGITPRMAPYGYFLLLLFQSNLLLSFLSLLLFLHAAFAQV